jgi:hypothetical protein
MPTFIHSKLSVFWLDTAGGTLTDISTYCDEVGFPEEMDLVETTTFGATSKTYLLGFADGKITISGNWDRTIDVQLSAIKSAFRAGTLASVTFEYGPEGASSGDKKYTGEAVMVNYEKNSAVKDQVKFSAEFQITGAVTDTNY